MGAQNTRLTEYLLKGVTMDNAVIIYGSTTGSTQTAAEWIGKALSSSGVKTDTLNVRDAKPETTAPYDLVILGSSTWGQGELQDDFINFTMG